MANCNDDDYDFDDFVQGIYTTLTIGIDLLLFPGFINLATIHLMRQVYAEERHKRKKQR